MAVLLRVPTHLRTYTGGAAGLEVHGTTVAEVLRDLNGPHAGLRSQLVDDKGRLRRFFRLYVNDMDTPSLCSLDTPVRDGDEITVLVAVAGG